MIGVNSNKNKYYIELHTNTFRNNFFDLNTIRINLITTSYVELKFQKYFMGEIVKNYQLKFHSFSLNIIEVSIHFK